ncbi:hypothetical protein AB0D11_30900 [Streptomyces monashensis]|uniref:hypothetical protein n=1 Tax=Streptomyces monashensis TaxID=1678012 RepID=UPI0033D1AACE
MDRQVFARLQNAGLEVLGWFTGSGPTVTEAFQPVVHIDATPVQRIPANAIDSSRRVFDAWKSHARDAAVLTTDGSFLLTVGLKYDWVKVRLTDTTDISALRDPEGELLIVARSLSGHHVCAVSTEEGEYWILEMDFHLQ